MPDRKPWMVADPAPGPYLMRGEPHVHAADRAVLRLAAPWVARLAPGARFLRRRVASVGRAATGLAAMDTDGLRAAADGLRAGFAQRGLAPALVARAFALVDEAAWRSLGIRYYPVQIMGAWALVEGRLAEMATGEGKTATAALAAASAALAGMPVHVVTVNDYLAVRDADELAPVYALLGLTCACIQQADGEAERRTAYAADITYVTNKELGFDFLRDRLAMARWRQGRAGAVDRLLEGAPAPRLRGLGFAIVDEADSVLIDEARTPLILAEREGDGGASDFAGALGVVARLRLHEHYRLHADRRVAELTPLGSLLLAAEAGRGGLWRFRRARDEMAEQALAALHLYRRDHEYILRDGGVQIVDEYTGRVAEGRHWDRGLHQMIELKEGAALTPQDRTAARITYQAFFRRYARLAGMSGTVAEHAAEFWSVYGLGIRRIPVHRKLQRRCTGQRLFTTSAARWDAVAESAARVAAGSRPVLIGTRSVAASEEIARRLTARGLPHRVLNARQDREEAAIVAGAGAAAPDGLGRITVATNMAGRGTDIRLAAGVGARGGLHVIVTEYHESPRIDRQLVGRGARQGDRGSWEALVAVDDALFTLHAPRLARLAGRLGLRRGWPLRRLRLAAQGQAQRLQARDRRAVLEADRSSNRLLAFAGGPV